MLSAGASMADFANVLRYAYRAGAHGFLAGRAIWWDALTAFPDLDACEAALATVGVPYFEQLGALTNAHATRWVPDHRGLDAFATEGAFARGRP
jgi:tagatose 1,6-diphosphate aldolase